MVRQRRERMRWLVVLIAVAGAAGAAEAAPNKRHASPRRAHADNMPRGWAWPPSATMKTAARSCEARLDELGVRWQPGKPLGHVVDPITVGDPASDMMLGGVRYVGRSTAPFELDCQLVLALETVGAELFRLGIREVHVASIYRWSNIRVGGKTKPILSRHALGLAMDVMSVVDDAGRELIVANDYKQGDGLLLAVEQAINGSGVFRLVLTPKNDPISHHDHFHLEANPDYSRPSS